MLDPWTISPLRLILESTAETSSFDKKIVPEGGKSLFYSKPIDGKGS